MDNSPTFDQEISQLMQSDPAAAARKIRDNLEGQKNTPLNIAITGESGSGKSTFINYFRGITNADEGAAPTGCVETTTEITEYTHPKYPNVILSDLPGIGTTKFPADKYLQHIDFKKFDFFILISATRFRENDVKLAREIHRMTKNFYFVRSKIDNDLQAEKRTQKDFNAEETLEKIRKDIIQGLCDEGFVAPQVFLLSSFELHLYDFPLLHETLERELPEHKKNALLLAMPNINLKIINKKKKAFQAQIKYYSAVSAVGAALPVPGLSVALDLGLMMSVVIQYIVGFRLDTPSLKMLADSTDVPFDDLKAVINSTLVAEDVTKDVIMKCLNQITNLTALLAAEEASNLIPLFGIPVAITLSALTTHRALNCFLDTLADDAQSVFRRALGLKPLE